MAQKTTKATYKHKMKLFKVRSKNSENAPETCFMRSQHDNDNT